MGFRMKISRWYSYSCCLSFLIWYFCWWIWILISCLQIVKVVLLNARRASCFCLYSFLCTLSFLARYVDLLFYHINYLDWIFWCYDPDIFQTSSNIHMCIMREYLLRTQRMVVCRVRQNKRRGLWKMVIASGYPKKKKKELFLLLSQGAWIIESLFGSLDPVFWILWTIIHLKAAS